MKRILSVLLLLTLGLAGCTLYRIDSEDISAKYHPSKPASDVQVLESVSQPHEIVGFVKVNAERNRRMSDVIDQMKREAGIIGGDAITNITSNASGYWRQLQMQELIGNAYVRADFSATVVAFTKQ